MLPWIWLKWGGQGGVPEYYRILRNTTKKLQINQGMERNSLHVSLSPLNHYFFLVLSEGVGLFPGFFHDFPGCFNPLSGLRGGRENPAKSWTKTLRLMLLIVFTSLIFPGLWGGWIISRGFHHFPGCSNPLVCRLRLRTNQGKVFWNFNRSISSAKSKNEQTAEKNWQRFM